MNTKMTCFKESYKGYRGESDFFSRLVHLYCWHKILDPIYSLDRSKVLELRPVLKANKALIKAIDNGDKVRKNHKAHKVYDTVLSSDGAEQEKILRLLTKEFDFKFDYSAFLKSKPKIPLKCSLLILAYIRKNFSYKQNLEKLRTILSESYLSDVISYYLYSDSGKDLPMPCDDETAGANGWVHVLKKVLERSAYRGLSPNEIKILNQIGEELLHSSSERFEYLLNLGCNHFKVLNSKNLIEIYEDYSKYKYVFDLMIYRKKRIGLEFLVI